MQKRFIKKNIWNRKRNTIHLIFDLTGHSRRKKCPLLSIHAKSNAKWNFQFMFHFSCFSFLLLLLLFNVHWNFVCMHVSSADMHRMDKRQRGRGGREWCEERAREEKNIRTKAVQTILIKDSLLLNDWMATTATSAAPGRRRREENEEYDISNGFFCNSNTVQNGASNCSALRLNSSYYTGSGPGLFYPEKYMHHERVLRTMDRSFHFWIQCDNKN